MSRRAVVAILVAGVLLGPSAIGADVSVNINIEAVEPPPLVVTAPPPLVVVPMVPIVQYTPSLDVDLFFFGGSWYYWHGGHWFAAPSHRGPWTYVRIEKVPGAILAVPVKYYKAPPGQLKKLESGHPGRAKGKGKGHD